MSWWTKTRPRTKLSLEAMSGKPDPLPESPGMKTKLHWERGRCWSILGMPFPRSPWAGVFCAKFYRFLRASVDYFWCSHVWRCRHCVLFWMLWPNTRDKLLKGGRAYFSLLFKKGYSLSWWGRHGFRSMRQLITEHRQVGKQKMNRK